MKISLRFTVYRDFRGSASLGLYTNLLPVTRLGLGYAHIWANKPQFQRFVYEGRKEHTKPGKNIVRTYSH